MVEDVGILAIEFYMPTQYVEQTDLEQYDGVSKGKYTIGLGQHRMGFCADCEDAISMAMTVVRRMLDKHNVDASQIGRLEVGTESGVDRSKSIKSYLMQLFGDNHDVLGLDTVQACFGGTQALFNAVDWLTSAAWDGRLALVVASDVAAYPPGPARPTGGAGAVALLLGPNAPLVIEPRLRSVYSAHCYDFYKPDPKSEYPLVDGSLSITSYINAALQCYQGLTKKFEKLKNTKFSLKDSCAVLFHSPYTRLVEKTFAKLVESDVRHKLAPENVDQLVRKTPEFAASNGHVNGNGDSLDSSSPKTVQQPSKELQAASKELFDSLTSPSLWLAREIGNMYTPSLYACLVSFLASYQLNGHGNDRRLLLFSYGSGLASAMFSIQLKVSSPAFEQLCVSIFFIIQQPDVFQGLRGIIRHWR